MADENSAGPQIPSPEAAAVAAVATSVGNGGGGGDGNVPAIDGAATQGAQEAAEEKSDETIEQWSARQAAVEKKAQYGAHLSWQECETAAADAGLMLCDRCRAGVSFARGCNARSNCYGTVCRTCSDANLLCHDHAAGELPNDF